MEYETPNQNERINSSSFVFKHFNTSNDCDIYLRNNPHITVAYKCCGGKGYASPVRNPPTQILSPNRNQIKDVCRCPFKNLIKVENGTCDICFIEDKDLYCACDTCKHPICMECLQQLKTVDCPYCRGKLRTSDL
jgi:hypothetical protein